MREATPNCSVLGKGEDLSLVLEATEGARVDNACAVARRLFIDRAVLNRRTARLVAPSPNEVAVPNRGVELLSACFVFSYVGHGAPFYSEVQPPPSC